MRAVQIRLLKPYEGYKANTLLTVLEWKYYELKREGIAVLRSGSGWKETVIPDEEE